MLDPDAPLTSRAVFDRRRAAVRLPVQVSLLHGEPALAEFLRDEAIVQVEALVLAEHLAADVQEADVRTPASWWEHAKHDAGQTRLGLWWRGTSVGAAAARRWPTRYRVHTLTVRWERWATRPLSQWHPTHRLLGPVVYQEDAACALTSEVVPVTG